MKAIQGLIAGGAFAVYVAMGAAAFAQPAPAPTQATAARGMPDRHHGAMRQAESPAERATRLRNALQLRPNQEPALQSYVNAMESARSGMMGPRPATRPSTTPERLALMEQKMAQHQSAMSSMIQATRTFYDQLDANQKKAFDAMPRLGWKGSKDGWGHRGGPGHMMGDMPMGPPPASPAPSR